MKDLIVKEIEPLLGGMQLMIVDDFSDIHDIEVPTGRCYATVDAITKTESYRRQVTIEMSIGVVASDFFNERFDLLSTFMLLPNSDKVILRQRERKLTVMSTGCKLLFDIKEEIIDGVAKRLHLNINGKAVTIGE